MVLFSNSRAKSLASMATATLLLAGCVGVTDPFPHAENLEIYKISDDERKVKFAGDLPKAIDVVNDQRLEYIQGARNQSYMKTYGAIGLVALSATSLFLGITSSSRASRDAITAMGIGGASYLGLNTFLSSPPRQQLYFKATVALDCAVLSMRPLLMLASDYTSLKSNMTNLGNKIAVTKVKLSAVEGAIATLSQAKPNHPLLANALSQVSDTNSQLTKMDALQTNAAGLIAQVDVAHVTLITHVRQIVDLVNEEIRKTEPKLESIQSTLIGLGDLAGTIAPGTDFTAKAKSGTKADLHATGPDYEGDLKNALANLASEQAEMLKAAHPVAVQVAKYEDLKAMVNSKITDCEAPTAALALNVDPNVDEMSVTAGETYSFAVFSEVGAPRAYFSGIAPPESAITIALENGVHVVKVKIGASEDLRETVLVLADSASPPNKKRILLKIKGKPPQSDDQTDPSNAPELPDAEKNKLATLSVLQAMTLQAGLNDWSANRAKTPFKAKLIVDGKIGSKDNSKTKSAVAQFRNGESIPKDKTSWDKISAFLTEESPSDGKGLVNLSAKLNKAKKAINNTEEVLVDDDIKGLQKSLGEMNCGTDTQSGEFDEETRNAILAVQNKNDLPKTGTILDSKISTYLTDKKDTKACN